MLLSRLWSWRLETEETWLATLSWEAEKGCTVLFWMQAVLPVFELGAQGLFPLQVFSRDSEEENVWWLLPTWDEQLNGDSFRTQTLLSEWLMFSRGFMGFAFLPGEAGPQKKPSGDEIVLLTVFFCGRGGGCEGGHWDLSWMEPAGKGTEEKICFPVQKGEWLCSYDCPRRHVNNNWLYEPVLPTVPY